MLIKDLNEFALTSKQTEPFSSLSIDFLVDLSTTLNVTKKAKSFSDVMAFAFWCRRANLERMKKEANVENEFRLNKGVVFHIVPSNVPTMFAYSMAVGILTGNINIIKLPSQKFEQINIICNAIEKSFGCFKYKKFKKELQFIRYPSNDSKFTDYFSSVCNVRMIWGGDATIDKVRLSKLPVRSTDIVFSDRCSLCVLSSNAVDSLSEFDIGLLAKRFYNDTYAFDQNACSSPFLIVWFGDKNNYAIKQKFWDAVDAIADKKYKITKKIITNKLLKTCSDVIDLPVKYKHGKLSASTRIGLEDVVEKLEEKRLYGGYFYEYTLDSLHELFTKFDINGRYQTLTYFGINLDETKELMKECIGIDRIVPIGQALDFNWTWDGIDLIRVLTRKVDVK